MAEVKKSVGRPKLRSRRMPFIEKFNLPEHRDKEIKMPCKFVTQLENCADDLARRLILGIGEKA